MGERKQPRQIFAPNATGQPERRDLWQIRSFRLQGHKPRNFPAGLSPERSVAHRRSAGIAATQRCARPREPPCQGASHALFSSTFRAYISGCRRKPAMAINGRRNKPFGPGGSTRRLHQLRGSLAGDRIIGRRSPLRGRNRIDEGVKGVLLLGMVPPLSGHCNSCQRQLCSGCSGRVSGLKDRSKALTG